MTEQGKSQGYVPFAVEQAGRRCIPSAWNTVAGLLHLHGTGGKAEWNRVVGLFHLHGTGWREGLFHRHGTGGKDCSIDMEQAGRTVPSTWNRREGLFHRHGTGGKDCSIHVEQAGRTVPSTWNRREGLFHPRGTGGKDCSIHVEQAGRTVPSTWNRLLEVFQAEWNTVVAASWETEMVLVLKTVWAAAASWEMEMGLVLETETNPSTFKKWHNVMEEDEPQSQGDLDKYRLE
ncbi:hypothetical protein BKA70DRAFT_1226269 [Coprinopsis sp. MPI-PUGE-AT-0042]|nr:hypothetical protein BKA70DRAFT_1226269 [Coprinopsis sp. MPI-PUGE-AT-0042]